jgi:hypothetical protein
MKTAYICSPYSGDTKRNKQYARELTARAIQDGYAPITPHLYITECLDDNEPSQRELGLNAGLALLSVCDIIIVGTKYGISDGMETEIFRARRLGLEEVECN